MGVKIQNKEMNRERTVELLNTYTGLKHTNTTSAFSLPTNLGLEIINIVALLIGWLTGLLKQYIEEITCDLIGQHSEINNHPQYSRSRRRREKKKITGKH